MNKLEELESWHRGMHVEKKWHGRRSGSSEARRHENVSHTHRKINKD